MTTTTRRSRARVGLAAGAAVTLLVLAGCSDGGDAPEADPTSAPTETVPGDSPPRWEPTVPEQPVDPATVETSYTAVLDAAVAATGDEPTFGRATLVTDEYDGICAVQVSRVATGSSSPDPDEVRAALAPAVADLGFDDLDSADDPGGAVLFVAHDDADALFEWRSKTETTIAVRVATAASECQP